MTCLHYISYFSHKKILLIYQMATILNRRSLSMFLKWYHFYLPMLLLINAVNAATAQDYVNFSIFLLRASPFRNRKSFLKEKREKITEAGKLTHLDLWHLLSTLDLTLCCTWGAFETFMCTCTWNILVCAPEISAKAAIFCRRQFWTSCREDSNESVFLTSHSERFCV